jgi:hypothetical protein
MSVRVAVYTLRVMADDNKTDDENQEVADSEELGVAFDAAEHLIGNALPEGYYCKIEG